MSSYFLYIPFSRKEASVKLNLSINQWVKSEKENNKEVIVTYRGEKGLTNLPQSAKIYVLMHGQPQEPSPLIRSSKIPSQLARNFNDLSRHLRLTEGKNSRLVPEVADDMVSDGLLNNITHSRLRIKLFFFDVGTNAKSLAKSFSASLAEQKTYRKGEIRIDYYPNSHLYPPERVNGNLVKHVRNEGVSSEIPASASSIRQSIFNHLSSRPTLTLEQVKSAVAEYNAYKSSRAYGLSGFLNLNGLFSSRESSFAIRALLNDSLSDQARYLLTKKFLEDNPNNYFAKCLSPKMSDAIKADNLYWKSEENTRKEYIYS